MREQKCFTIIHALASLPSPISTAYPAPVQLYNTNQPTGSYTYAMERVREGLVLFEVKLQPAIHWQFKAIYACKNTILSPFKRGFAGLYSIDVCCPL